MKNPESALISGSCEFIRLTVLALMGGFSFFMSGTTQKLGMELIMAVMLIRDYFSD